MRVPRRASWLFLAAPVLASSSACAGRVEQGSVAAGACETAGQTATCFDDGKAGTQTCLASLMMWSKCAPPGQPSSVPQPVCTLGDTQTCDLGSGFQGAQSCVASASGTPVWTDCCNGGSAVSCTTPDGQAGFAYCSSGQVVSGCGVPDGCDPRNTPDSSGCVLANGQWLWESASGADTPLVLAFRDERVVFTHASGAFDLAGRDASFGSDWVSAETPWLAMDLDADGRIDDGRELFGSMTELPGGERAPNGFVALAALDDDGDGAITPRDAAFAHLLLWRDADQDRRSSRDEVMSAAEAGLVAIRLDYRSAPHCSDGNCEIERARFVFRDASGVEREGSVVDVHLARR